MDALKAARDAISKRARDPRAVALGLSGDLKVIGCALDELERRTEALAAQVLRIRAGLTWHPAQLKELGEMGEEAATVLRIAEHGERCGCEACMYGRLNGK